MCQVSNPDQVDATRTEPELRCGIGLKGRLRDHLAEDGVHANGDALRGDNGNYAIAATGFAGPTGGTKDIPVGTIWLACGNDERVVTLKVEEDHGRDINLAIATNKAMELFLNYLKEENDPRPVYEG